MKFGKKDFVVVMAVLAVVILAFAVAAQAVAQEAVDPVCGMKVDTATAKYKLDFEGKTFYFCSESCLKKFQADPCKYCSEEGGAKTAAKPAVQTAAKPGTMAGGQQCPMMGAMKDVKVEVVNLPDGVQLKITSVKPEVVKQIQAMYSKKAGTKTAACCSKDAKGCTGKDCGSKCGDK